MNKEFTKWTVWLLRSRIGTGLFLIIQIAILIFGMLVAFNDLVYGGMVLFAQFCFLAKVDYTVRSYIKEARCSSNSSSGCR